MLSSKTFNPLISTEAAEWAAPGSEVDVTVIGRAEPADAGVPNNTIVAADMTAIIFSFIMASVQSE
jgi:hypothetical protein